MSLERNILRREAKAAYKEQTKGIPKNQRIPFAVFFKNYKASKLNKTELEDDNKEDFNIDNLLNDIRSESKDE